MQQDITETEFERLSWHGNIVTGLRFDVGAGGFTQRLRTEPVVLDGQSFPRGARPWA